MQSETSDSEPTRGEPGWLLPSPIPEACAQFDFLLGDWRIETTRYAPDGHELVRLPGTWHAESRHGGRVVLDEVATFTPDGAGLLAAFVTLRTWCPETARWEMTFVSAHRPVTLDAFTGIGRSGEMHLEARGLDASGEPVRARVRFHDIGADAFRWEQCVEDATGSFRPVVRIRARRAEPAAAPRIGD